MANNRMWLVHPPTRTRIRIAKYYPSTGWYCPEESFSERLNQVLDAVDFSHLSEEENADRLARPSQHGYVARGGMLGERWVLAYDVEPEEAKP